MKKIPTTTIPARLLAFCLVFFSAGAQTSAQPDSTAPFPLANSPKVILHLTDGSNVKGTVLYITDSSITLARRDSSGTSGNYVVPTQAIKSIKLKRNAVIAGLAIGGLIGYGAGYITGYVTHKDDPTLSDDANHENAQNVARVVAIGGAVGLGVVGGAIAPVFARKKFVINGDREAMKKFIKVLSRTP